jgi:catechol-2,3-dioxygenase
MTGFRIGHIGLHVRNIEEEVAFLRIIGGELTSVDRMPRGRVAFVSLDGVHHHSLALFEDGSALPSGDSKKETLGIHHIALPTGSREEVDRWGETLEAHGIAIDGPYIQGPEGDGLDGGSGSYAIFFTDPNGICFEIYTGAMTVAEFRREQAARAKETQPA